MLLLTSLLLLQPVLLLLLQPALLHMASFGLMELAYPCGSLMTFVSQIVSQLFPKLFPNFLFPCLEFVSLFGICFPVWNLFPFTVRW